MKLGDLITVLPSATLVGDGNTEISGIVYDSRRATHGDLFVCIRGFRQDGHDFIDDALVRGAAAIAVQDEALLKDLVEKNLKKGISRKDQEEARGKEPVSSGRKQATAGGSKNSREDPGKQVPVVHVADTRQALGLLSAHFYGYPSRHLRLIGVTGTNGKTTTTYLIKALLEAAGYKVGLIGTIQNLIGDTPLKTERTTPESVDLQRLFRQMMEAGCQYAVMEVSSHAIALKRTVGSEFDVGVFTNITQDHLDFHPSFAAYLQTKTRFFAELGVEGVKARKLVVLNQDDAHSRFIQGQTRVPVVTYGMKSGATYRAQGLVIRPNGLSYRLFYPRGEVDVNLSLAGARFNVYNSLAALAVCLQEGVPLGRAVEALSRVTGIPGRLETVDQGQPFTVLVDYAHTPDSLENVLHTIADFTRGKRIVVFGCGGDRDKSKRPLMGEIAGRLADMVIITSDNPRSEDPAAICRDIEVGLKRTIGNKPYEVIVDRKEAIRRAINQGEPGDVILIAGKGHETYQIFRDKTIHFDDREEAAQALKERYNKE